MSCLGKSCVVDFFGFIVVYIFLTPFFGELNRGENCAHSRIKKLTRKSCVVCLSNHPPAAFDFHISLCQLYLLCVFCALIYNIHTHR